jgi:hypothetical protein
MNEQQLAAVKMALEDLYPISHNTTDDYRGKADKAITALQSIISQDALDKMAENARELGLDYEPAVQEVRLWAVFCGGCRKEWSVPYQHPGKSICAECEAKCKDTPPAQPAVQEGRDWSLLAATQESLREHMAEIVRLKAAQNPWVNLTDEEMKDLWAIHSGPPLYRAIEAKLKEKNT